MSWVRCLSVLSDFPLFHSGPAPEKPTVLVAGYGWATHEFVKHINPRRFNVRIVSERDQRLNQNKMIGLMASSYTSALVPVIKDRCVSIDKERNVVKGAGGGEYPYDYLVVATGSEVNDFGIPGVKEHCMPCKTGEDIEAIRAKQSEGAVILGAGPTGVELACALKKRGVANIRLIEAADTLLPGFSLQFREAALARLVKKGIQMQFGELVQKIDRDQIVTKRGAIPYGPTDLLVWTCGVKPVEFARGLVADDNLSAGPNIFVMGDACRKGPPTAQNAVQQGRYLADYFNGRFAKKEPYAFRELGRCVDLGDGHLIEVKGFLFFLPYLEFEDLLWFAL